MNLPVESKSLDLGVKKLQQNMCYCTPKSKDLDSTGIFISGNHLKHSKRTMIRLMQMIKYDEATR
ncbi:hypothetical protein MHK_004803 [Candidatus Magnetomorum sp. HK-1]|nr:hypothetical protein MHK_004803 [Candidatus Magnetomorum sp. HK-1]